MQSHELKITMEIRATTASVADAGKVRLGGESPSFGRSAPASVNRSPHSAGGDPEQLQRVYPPVAEQRCAADATQRYAVPGGCFD